MTKKTAVFRSKNLHLRDTAISILERERPMTLRALYYRLVSAGAFAATDKSYNRLKVMMTKLRECGEVPITGWLVDRVRSTLKPSSWTGLADYGDTIRQAYRKDLWAQMPHHIEIFVEKDAIAGTIQPVTSEYDIALNVIRGDVSVSYAGEIAAQWREIEKPIFAYYLGDFDPAGFGIEKVLREKLGRYSERLIIPVDRGDFQPAELDLAELDVCWTRLAVNADDFDEFNLIRLPVKRTATRARAFIQEHGVYVAEVDAIPPAELRQRIQDAIESHIDQDRWARLKRTEELEKDRLIDLIGQWGR